MNPRVDSGDFLFLKSCVAASGLLVQTMHADTCRYTCIQQLQQIHADMHAESRKPQKADFFQCSAGKNTYDLIWTGTIPHVDSHLNACLVQVDLTQRFSQVLRLEFDYRRSFLIIFQQIQLVLAPVTFGFLLLPESACSARSNARGFVFSVTRVSLVTGGHVMDSIHSTEI